MTQQPSIEREHTQGIRVIELGGNQISPSSRRKRNLSGPNSAGEKSLIKKDPIWLISAKTQIPVFNSCLSSLDEVVATPAFNVNVIESAYDKNFKLFDVINNSKYVGLIDSTLASLGMFAVSIGLYVIQYCKLREIEKNSNYFYFNRLFKSFNQDEIKNKMGEIKQEIYSPDDLITYEYLQTAAYFYPPDISPIACWRRRTFASGIEKARLKALDLFLKKSKKKKLDKLLEEATNKKDGINENVQDLYGQNFESYLQTVDYFYSSDLSKINYWRRRFFASKKRKKQLRELDAFLNSTLDGLHKKITEHVCNFLNTGVYESLNNETESKYFKTEKDARANWIIILDEKYKNKFFQYVDHLIKDNSDTRIKENLERKNNILLPIISAFMQTSFIYWILVFLFYFIPITIITPVVSGALISVAPVVLSIGVFLPFLLFLKIRNANQIYNADKNLKKELIENQHKSMLEKKIVGLSKQNLYVKCTQYEKFTTKIKLKDSTLLKELHAVIKKRSFSKYHAMFMGFLEGCFFPLFVGWVSLDAIKVILTYALCPAGIPLTDFTPIGLLVSAIIASVIFILAIGYGIYTAHKAKKAHDLRFNDLEDKINALEKERGNKLILEKDYDRILRRYSSTKPLWTDVKKGINRFMAIIKRLGTGSLVFRLVLWAPAMAIYAAVVASSAVPTFFPIILIIGTIIGALALASWYLYAYNVESKTTQAQRIIEYFVQTEQLNEINQALTPVLESLVTQNSNTEASISTETLVSENDTKFVSQKSLEEDDSPKADNSHLEVANEVPVETEANKQVNDSNSHSQGLFKVNVLVHNENLKTCLSPAASV